MNLGGRTNSEFLFLFFSFLSPTPVLSPALQSESLASGSHFPVPSSFFLPFHLPPLLNTSLGKWAEMARLYLNGGHQKCLMHYNEKRHLYSHKAFSVLSQ